MLEAVAIGVLILVASTILISIGSTGIQNASQAIRLSARLEQIAKQTENYQRTQDDTNQTLGEIQATLHQIRISLAETDERLRLTGIEHAELRQQVLNADGVYRVAVQQIQTNTARIDALHARVVELPRNLPHRSRDGGDLEG